MASNVFVGADHRDIRLAGIDSLREIGGEDYEYIKIFSKVDQLDIRWLALESFSDNRYTVKSDVWSFGILLWEIFTYARAPFGAFSASEIAAEVRSGRRLEQPQGCPVELFTSMSRCWLEQPAARPTFSNLRGDINLLLLDNAGTLRAKVKAATDIKSTDNLRWELPIGELQLVSKFEDWKASPKSSAAHDDSKIPSKRCNAYGSFGIDVALHVAQLPGPLAKSALVLISDSSEGVHHLRLIFEAAHDIRHPRLINLLGCSSSSGFAVLFELPALGSLVTSATIAPGSTVSLPQRKRIGLHLALGIEYLHANNLVHGHISPHTVFVDERFNAKIMSYMAQTASTETHRNEVDTDAGFLWQAPEIILGQIPTFESDVFSFGMVIWSLLQQAGAQPFSNLFERESLDPSSPNYLVKPMIPITPVSMRVLVDYLRASGGAMPELESFDIRCIEPEFQEAVDLCTQRQPLNRPIIAVVATTFLCAVDGANRWEVPRDALTEIQKLGSGQFGDVFKMATTLFSAPSSAHGCDAMAVHDYGGSIINSGRGNDCDMDFVAVKTLKGQPDMLPEVMMKAEVDFIAEINLMKRFRHPNLVRLLGVCTEGAPLLMLLEFSKGGSLDEWLPQNGHKLLKPVPKKLVYILHQVARGCLALSQFGIVHRDLAARNILIGDHLRVKVADYGLSRDVDEDRNYYRLATERPLPVRWTSPESLATLTWTTASDCYSFGVVVFECFTFGSFPFDGIDDDTAFIATLVGTAPLYPLLLAQTCSVLAKYGATIPPLIHQLITMCTARNASLRPSFSELVRLTSRHHSEGIIGGTCVGGGRTDAAAIQDAGSGRDYSDKGSGGSSKYAFSLAISSA
jgi:serine/threonine protein kinase